MKLINQIKLIIGLLIIYSSLSFAGRYGDKDYDFDPSKMDSYSSGIPFIFKLIGWPILIGLIIFMVSAFFLPKEKNESNFDNYKSKLIIALPLIIILIAILK